MPGSLSRRFRHRIELLSRGAIPELDLIYPVLPSGSTLAGSIQETFCLLLLFGLGELAGHVKKKLAIELVLLVRGQCPVPGHIGLIKTKPAYLSVHEMTDQVIHGRGPGFTRNFEKDFEPLCRSAGVIGAEDCPSDVQVVVELLLVSLIPRHGPDVAGRGLLIGGGELALGDFDRRIWMFIRRVEVHGLRRVVAVVDGLPCGGRWSSD